MIFKCQLLILSCNCVLKSRLLIYFVNMSMIYIKNDSVLCSHSYMTVKQVSPSGLGHCTSNTYILFFLCTCTCGLRNKIYNTIQFPVLVSGDRVVLPSVFNSVKKCYKIILGFCNQTHGLMKWSYKM